MKVAVYTIAKDEEAHVERWASMASEADCRLILDTGSSDGTVAAARAAGVEVREARFDPWRFDDARNASLAAVPADVDYCIALDADEVLMPDWRDALEAAHDAGWTRPRYLYTWSWTEPGVPGLQYHGDKVHARTGYRWRHPVHEVLGTYGSTVETQGFMPGFEIHHHPDPSKSRGQYLPLLQMSVAEDPHDDRNSYYLARELMYAGRNDEAVAEFQRHLALPSARWNLERASSMRYLGRILDDEGWLLRAVAEAPDQREPRVELAEHYYRHGEWEACRRAALAALAVTERSNAYLIEGDSWSWKPLDQAAIACHRLGLHAEALEHGRAALAQAVPWERDRLAANLTWYEQAVE